MTEFPATERAELAVHRVLRGELSPWVHAVTAEVTGERVVLHVYHHTAPSGWRGEFEQDIDSEWDQVFPRHAATTLPALATVFHAAKEFTTPCDEPRLIYVNHWSVPAD